MLFWSFVLSFVMAILFYAVYPRTDQITIVEKPQAESAVMAFVNSHQAAKKMIYNLVDDYSISGKKVYRVYIDEMKKVGQYKNGEIINENEVVIFDPTINDNNLGLNDNLGYIRSGLRGDYNRGIKGYRLDDIYSAIACIKTGTDAEGNVTKELTFDCDEDITENYVITYADHPAWWDDTTKSRQLWRSALLKRSRLSNECGVLYPRSGGLAGNITGLTRYDVNSRYVLDNSQRFVISIPNEITEPLDAREGGDMSDYLFCITPIKNIMQNAEKEAERYNAQVGLEETTTAE